MAKDSPDMLANDLRELIPQCRKYLDDAEKALDFDDSTPNNLIVAGVSIGTMDHELGSWIRRMVKALDDKTV